MKFREALKCHIGGKDLYRYCNKDYIWKAKIKSDINNALYWSDQKTGNTYRFTTQDIVGLDWCIKAKIYNLSDKMIVQEPSITVHPTDQIIKYIYAESDINNFLSAIRTELFNSGKYSDSVWAIIKKCAGARFRC